MKLEDLQNNSQTTIVSGGKEKSIYCIMVLRMMDTEKFANNYCGALSFVCEVFPEIDADELEKELDKFI